MLLSLSIAQAYATSRSQACDVWFRKRDSPRHIHARSAYWNMLARVVRTRLTCCLSPFPCCEIIQAARRHQRVAHRLRSGHLSSAARDWRSSAQGLAIAFGAAWQWFSTYSARNLPNGPCGRRQPSSRSAALRNSFDYEVAAGSGSRPDCMSPLPSIAQGNHGIADGQRIGPLRLLILLILPTNPVPHAPASNAARGDP